MAIPVSQSVMEILDQATITGNKLKLGVYIDRKLYLEAAKVIEAAGGKWNRKAKAHIFDGDAAEAIEPIILTGEYSRKKQDFGQFDSPESVVRRVIELADFKPGCSVLEPSAGIGNLACAAEQAGGIVTALEVDSARAAIANTRLANGCRTCDFLTEGGIERKYDRVVMNPPFSDQEDIRHVRHALGSIREDGLLVSVMSAGALFRTNSRTRMFREMVREMDGRFEPLPLNSFKDSGTAVNACIVVIPGLMYNFYQD